MGTEKHTFDTYAPSEIQIVCGEGAWLYDDKDNAYLDCTSGIAVNALGHGHPHLVETLKKSADGLWHLSNLFTMPEQLRLSERLCEASFADRVFFTNSGAEAMECSIKTARRYHYANGAPERVNIITFEGAFHGRTIATIAAGGQEKYLEGFGEKAPGFLQVPFADHEALKNAVDEKTAAILIEPVQGEGGVRSVPKECLKGIRELCDEHGILLIYDEVQCGIGRTGKLFAHEGLGADPDIMGIAKGLGGGFPVGACLASEEVAAAMVLGTHGSTFGGNPLAMSIGNAVLDVVLEDGFLEKVRERAGQFQQVLSEILDSYPDLFEDVRGDGLLLGMKAKVSNLELMAAFREQNLLVLVAGNNVVRILPPLVISEEEIREVRKRMIAALDTFQDGKA